MLYGVNAQDPVTYASVGILFAVVALAACWIPSYNASQLDPITALKYE
jgi:ABC-type antimicrobial peptide transport system permease subunit